MRVDFFRIEGTEQHKSAARALAAALAAKDDKSRTKTISGVPFRAQELKHVGRFWDGDIVRIRMDDIPIIVSLDGKLDEVDLDNDEGIGEETAFRYDTTTKVLMIQRHRSGVTASKWARYFEAIGNLVEPLIPVIIPAGDAGKAITKLKVVRKIHVRYAGLPKGSIAIDPGDGTARQLASLANTAPVFEMIMGMSRQRGGLDLQKAKDFLRTTFQKAKAALSGDGDSEVERIDVIGTFDDDAKAKMDLLQFFMREEVEVEVNPSKRRMLYDDRIAGIAVAFNQQRAELERRYASEH